VAEKEYIIPYSEDVRKRHYHKTIRGKVVKFMVQLEFKYEGDWKEVVRYDCATVMLIGILIIYGGGIQKMNCISVLKML